MEEIVGLEMKAINKPLIEGISKITKIMVINKTIFLKIIMTLINFRWIIIKGYLKIIVLSFKIIMLIKTMEGFRGISKIDKEIIFRGKITMVIIGNLSTEILKIRTKLQMK
jgi:hypothetical protein